MGDGPFLFVCFGGLLHLVASPRVPLRGRRFYGVDSRSPRLPGGSEHGAELFQRDGLAFESDSDLDLPPDQGHGFLRDVFPHLITAGVVVFCLCFWGGVGVDVGVCWWWMFCGCDACGSCWLGADGDACLGVLSGMWSSWLRLCFMFVVCVQVYTMLFTFCWKFFAGEIIVCYMFVFMVLIVGVDVSSIVLV